MMNRKTGLIAAAIVSGIIALPIGATAIASEDDKNGRYEHCEEGKRGWGHWFGRGVDCSSCDWIS